MISALVGIAIERGLDRRRGATDRHVLPGARRQDEADRDKRAITIEDLLTMRSGLETTSNRNYGAWVQSRELGRAMRWHGRSSASRARKMGYSTGNTHCCRRSSPRPPARARGSSRRKRSPGRSASRWPVAAGSAGHLSSAATTC